MIVHVNAARRHVKWVTNNVWTLHNLLHILNKIQIKQTLLKPFIFQHLLMFSLYTINGASLKQNN